MKIEYDQVKYLSNLDKHGVDFNDAIQLDWDTATIREDTRKSYAETRYIAVGYLRSRLHILVYTLITGGIRAISFRKANAREVDNYES